MNWPGEKLLTEVWKSIHALATGLASPWQIRREGLAKADVRRLEILSEAQAKKDAEELVAGRARLDRSGNILPLEPPTQSLALPNPEGAPSDLRDAPAFEILSPEPERLTISQYATTVEHRDAVLKLINLRETARFAEEEAEAAAKAPEDGQPQAPHDDWIGRWREGAARTSDEAIQRLWAKLLVDETRRPGTFSLRTLQFLQLLDPEEARLINLLGPFVTNRNHVIKLPLLEQHGLGQAEIDHLADIGVLAVNSTSDVIERSVGKTVHQGEPLIFVLPGGVGVAATATAPTQINLPAYSVTRLGREVTLIGAYAASQDQVRALVSMLRQGPNVIVSVGEGYYMNKEKQVGIRNAVIWSA